MKKPAFFLIALYFLVCLVLSCSIESESGDLAWLSLQGAGGSEYIRTLSSDDPGAVVLSGVMGKTILFANYNSGSSDIDPSSQRALLGATGLGNPYFLNVFSGSSSRAAEAFVPDAGLPFWAEEVFTADNGSVGVVSSGGAKAAENHNALSSGAFVPGVTKRKFFLDDSINSSSVSWAEKSCVLLAKKEFSSGEGGCLVWINEEEAGSFSQKIGIAMAEKFEQFYGPMREVFGKEFEYLVDASGSVTEKTMENYNDVSSFVNIVLTDIGGDRDLPKNRQNGIAGFFTSKDYRVRTGSNCSNQGKFIYADTGRCLSEYGDGLDGKFVLTLVHEFQHMLNFSRKQVQGISCPLWYAEMLAMLAEDMMADSLGVMEAHPSSMLSGFNKYYWECSLGTSSMNSLDYALAYAFGAWAARNYGGIPFVKACAGNRASGMDSMVKAVNEVCGKSIDENTLRQEFVSACVFRNDFAAAKSLPGFRKSAEGFLPIDIFGNDFGYSLYSNSSEKTVGPMIFDSSMALPFSIKPGSFVLRSAGVAVSDTVQLNFSESRNSSDKIIIIIQDSFTNKGH